MRVNYYDTFYVRLYENDEQVYSVMDNGFETISDICSQVCHRYESSSGKKVDNTYELLVKKLDTEEFGRYKPSGRRIRL